MYSGRFCPSSCELTLNYVTFNDTDSSSSVKVRWCQSYLRTTSLYLCFDEFCENDGEKEQWIAAQGGWCAQYANVTLPPLHDVLDHWNSRDRDLVRRLGAEEALAWPTLDQVALPDRKLFSRAFITMDTAFRQYDLHRSYGWCMFYFWTIVIAVGVGSRLLALINRLMDRTKHYHPKPSHQPEDGGFNQRLIAPLKIWFRRKVLIPATFGARCSQPYGWCTIPPRVQSLTILSFVAINIILCSCSYELTDGNLYWPEKSAQLTRYVSDRTGIISLANFPLIWIFGMRNDVLIWITGWGFGTYNAFHRWVARVATIQAIIHSLGYTLMITQSGGWFHFLKYWTKHYFWNGEIATIAMSALLIFSVYGLRRSHYEIFLVTHIALSIASLWTMYYHVEIFTAGEWNVFIWPCLFIWLFDRVLRAGRVLAFNRHFWSTKATLTYNPSSNLIRMEISAQKALMKPKPGTYYYIHVLNNMWYMHQSHPFTLAYVSSDEGQQPSLILSPISSQSSRPSPSRRESVDSSESDALLVGKGQSLLTNLVFLIRPYNGFTARLKSYCLSSPRKIKVLLDGPYGHSEPLHLFRNIIFIVGGTGIAVPLSHLARLLSPVSYVYSVKIVWAVREHAFLASILQEFSGLLADERVEMEVHITQDREVMDEALAEDVKRVRIMTKRPDVGIAIQEAAHAAEGQDLAVVACGPALMADEARKATVSILEKGHSGVEYFEESFKW